ncbi:MAG: glycosyltransferase [Eubacteriales bacterium]|nr:glycosyltransferase [Eubacteriales bacterium]
MKIGLLITSMGNFGQKGFYNAQEIGLAKALDSLGNEVIVYKLVSIKERKHVEKIDSCKHSRIIFYPTKCLGINGIIDTKILDTSLDALIYFSDTQFCVPKVYKWARKNSVKFFPYIGVIESHSNNKMKKKLVNGMFKRNLRVYKKCHCFTKTPTVKMRLEEIGVKNVTVTPVGLDLSLLESDFENYDLIELKKKYCYKSEDKVLLFIGRLIEEKQPIRMIEIFSELYQQNTSLRLLIVGTGELKDQVTNLIKKKELEDYIQMIDKIPNKNIWELYRIADCFVNLNQQEIFGMAILEAMYYGCKVVAWQAPGPNLIIEDGVSGWLAASNEDVKDYIKNPQDMSMAAYNRIVNKFTWASTAKTIIRRLQEEKNE